MKSRKELPVPLQPEQPDGVETENIVEDCPPDEWDPSDSAYPL